MDAITRVIKSQADRIKSLENVIKSYSEGNINERLEIHSQMKNVDKRATSRAVQDIKNFEQEVKAAERDIDMMDIDA